MSYEEYAKLEDENLRPQVNRATRVAYPPGSIFKIVVSLACLDAGLDPLQPFYCPQVIWVGRRAIKDPQGNPNGDYDFRHAFMKSSNSYFITNGLVYGPQGIIRLGPLSEPILNGGSDALQQSEVAIVKTQAASEFPNPFDGI